MGIKALASMRKARAHCNDIGQCYGALQGLWTGLPIDVRVPCRVFSTGLGWGRNSCPTCCVVLSCVRRSAAYLRLVMLVSDVKPAALVGV